MEERLCLCTPTEPAVMARLLLEENTRCGAKVGDIRIESGSEDLPDAYRTIPVKPEHLRYNVVAVQTKPGAGARTRQNVAEAGANALKAGQAGTPTSPPTRGVPTL